MFTNTPVRYHKKKYFLLQFKIYRIFYQYFTYWIYITNIYLMPIFTHYCNFNEDKFNFVETASKCCRFIVIIPVSCVLANSVEISLGSIKFPE